jgi:hypothetical protein
VGCFLADCAALKSALERATSSSPIAFKWACISAEVRIRFHSGLLCPKSISMWGDTYRFVIR